LRMKWLALATGLTLIAAAVAMVVAAHVIVPRLLANLAETIKVETGRELSIGEVGVTLLPLPAVTLRQVRFANAAWGSQPWLVQADRVNVQIDAVALPWVEGVAGDDRVRHRTVRRVVRHPACARETSRGSPGPANCGVAHNRRMCDCEPSRGQYRSGLAGSWLAIARRVSSCGNVVGHCRVGDVQL